MTAELRLAWYVAGVVSAILAVLILQVYLGVHS